MNKSINIALIGARGYVGNEIVSIINEHPFCFITKAYSRTSSGQLLRNYKKEKVFYSKPNLKEMNLDGIDLVIIGLPNGFSSNYIDYLDTRYPEIKVIDLSSDNRFNTRWGYRIPEFCTKKKYTRISNPGCYASLMQFALMPLKNLIDGTGFCFGISGYSGAGSNSNERNNKIFLKDNVLPYALKGHIHEREVETYCYDDIKFIPHVGNFFRGISLTISLKINQNLTEQEISELFENYYKNNTLIRITKNIPTINNIYKTHFVDIGGFAIDSCNNLTFCSALDNLLKGAATQAIQNLNFLFNLNDLEGIYHD